jgi:membrane protein implicated in regulation of membrane protease activity
MNARTEGAIAIAAALLVLFSAMWDSRISVVVSVVVLVALGVYRFVQKEK